MRISDWSSDVCSSDLIVYPFAEGLAGVLMTAHVLPWLSIPVALFIGSIGAVSVFKAVYIDKRTLKCACVGGSSKVPLGFVSLNEIGRAACRERVFRYV